MPFNGENIKQVNSIKSLGLIIDLKLTWEQHIAHIQHKISKTIGIICKTRHCFTERMLYYTLIYPYLHYGNMVWANTYQSNLDPLKKLQKKIIRTISFAGFTDHTPPIFKKLSVLPFDQINKEKTALFMFRYFNNMLPSRCKMRELGHLPSRDTQHPNHPKSQIFPVKKTHTTPNCLVNFSQEKSENQDDLGFSPQGKFLATWFLSHLFFPCF